jgi:uncharacterized protein (UPF0335 family)
MAGTMENLAAMNETDAVVPEGMHNSAKDQLRIFVERIERLEEEKKALSDDLKEVYAEAKSTVRTKRCVRSPASAGRPRAEQSDPPLQALG